MKKVGRILLLISLMGVLAACSLFGKGEEVPKYENVALGKPTHASSHFVNGAGIVFSPDKAVDGEYGREDRWLTKNHEPGPHWLEIDLLGTYKLYSAEIHTGNGDGSTAHPVTEFKLQYDKDGEWVDIPDAGIENNENALVIFDFSEPVETTKVRFYSEEEPELADGARLLRVVEILVFGEEVE